MNGEIMLNKLEWSLLTSTIERAQPLFFLYTDMMTYVEEASFDLILQALVMLTQRDLIMCLFVNEGGSSISREDLNFTELKRHCTGRSEDELRKYPVHREQKGEYYFEVTEKGRIEEAREIYREYYLDE